MIVGETDQFSILAPEAKHVLEVSGRRLQLSARAYQRVCNLSRTSADLADSDLIQAQHIAKAVQYRPKV